MSWRENIRAGWSEMLEFATEAAESLHEFKRLQVEEYGRVLQAREDALVLAGLEAQFGDRSCIPYWHPERFTD